MKDKQKKMKFREKYNYEKNLKPKMIIDFDFDHHFDHIQKNTDVKPISRFFYGKMLIFTNVSLMSFIYDLIEIFTFPNKSVTDIYSKNKILRCFPYHNLTETDRTSLMLFSFVNLNQIKKKMNLEI